MSNLETRGDRVVSAALQQRVNTANQGDLRIVILERGSGY